MAFFVPLFLSQLADSVVWVGRAGYLSVPYTTAIEQNQPTIPSGLYLFHTPTVVAASGVNEGENTAGETYVVYWPEDLTWEDDAPSDVVKNRANFMNYLFGKVDGSGCLSCLGGACGWVDVGEEGRRWEAGC